MNDEHAYVASELGKAVEYIADLEKKLAIAEEEIAEAVKIINWANEHLPVHLDHVFEWLKRNERI